MTIKYSHPYGRLVLARVLTTLKNTGTFQQKTVVIHSTSHPYLFYFRNTNTMQSQHIREM